MLSLYYKGMLITAITNFVTTSLNPIVSRLYPDKYGIRPDYTANFFPREYVDNPDFANRYQLEVYKFAAKVIKTEKCDSVVDVGCGHGIKLSKYIRPVCNDITGIDGRQSIDYCQANHPFGQWLVDDINHPAYPTKRKYDLVMAVDVIEHLINPDNLIKYLKKLTHKNSKVIISTPEREKLRGLDHLGPAGMANPAHVREWSQAELATYLSRHNLVVEKHFLVEDVAQPQKSIAGRNFGRTCQVVYGHFNCS